VRKRKVGHLPSVSEKEKHQYLICPILFRKTVTQKSPRKPNQSLAKTHIRTHILKWKSVIVISDLNDNLNIAPTPRKSMQPISRQKDTF
jgi:hypothetical protein